MAKKKPQRKPAKKTPSKKLQGRPTKYKPEYADMAKFVIEDSGFSMFKLAKLFNCSRTAIYRWMEAEPKFRYAVDKARDYFDGIKIHKSLVKRAVGFSYNEITSEPDKDGKMTPIRKVRKYFAPDIASIKHWQTNRHPEKWSDKREVSGKLTIEEIIGEIDSEDDKSTG